MAIVDEYTANAILVVPSILTVSSTDGGTVLTPGEGTFDYDLGEVLALEAVPVVGYQFAGWTGDISTIADPNAAETTITMNGEYTIMAVFEPVAVQRGSLHGHVYDKETKEPVQGVTVAFQTYLAETDIDGYYELPDIPVGSQEFVFMKAEYQIATRQTTIMADEFTTLDVELTPGEGPEPEFKFPWWLAAIIGAGVVAIATKKALEVDKRKVKGGGRGLLD